MDLDPARDPLTPMSPDLAPKSDDLRMSMEESETDNNKVKFSSGVREITLNEGPDDDAAPPIVISADDRMALSPSTTETQTYVFCRLSDEECDSGSCW